MKTSLLRKMRLPRWWVAASLLLLASYFWTACGSSPTDSRKIENEKKEKEDDPK
jgi:4-amino-4-deoxy-L-arabinose transferase-like glycosyltransferase